MRQLSNASIVILVIVSAVFCLNSKVAAKPGTLSLHPENPHYFLWRGQPTVLITSGEHYGAVLNLDFDFHLYLDTLAADGLNLTRTFTGGAYVEPQGAFNIARNTLAPERFICPWARSDTPGYNGGGNKFDLEQWDPAYFKRLKDFVAHAEKVGVVVEVNLFCPFYDQEKWKLSPFHPDNNINQTKNTNSADVYTMDKHMGLWKYQKRMTQKIVQELEPFDNIYYEICNEPYFGGVTMQWQRRIAKVIENTQKNHAHPKLISRNVANGSEKVTDPLPQVSVLNFHYASPPDAVPLNYHLNRVIGDNETGFRGTGDAPYRREAWAFILSGGALFNHLDYSFAAGYENGTFEYPSSQPGGGNPVFRQQLKYLADFINRFQFIHLKPDHDTVQGGVPEGLGSYVLSQPGQAYALYFGPPDNSKEGDPDASALAPVLNIPEGRYWAEWTDPLSGPMGNKQTIHHEGGTLELKPPRPLKSEAALEIHRF
jgi:hypothetical protein